MFELKSMSFELYCVEVEHIPYYNFLTEDERESVEERYIEYCKEKGLICDVDYEEEEN